MYIYLLELNVYDGNDVIDEHIKYYPWSLVSKVFTDARDINDVKRYALNNIKDIIESLNTDNPQGGFSISTYKIGSGAINIFDYYLSKSIRHIQNYSLTGDEVSGSFETDDLKLSERNLSRYMFDESYIPKFKVGDIVKYQDGVDDGIYVIIDTPKPIMSKYLKDCNESYKLKGISNENNYIYFNGSSTVIDSMLTPILDITNIDDRIITLHDFIFNKRTDIENINDEYLKWLIQE